MSRHHRWRVAQPLTRASTNSATRTPSRFPDQLTQRLATKLANVATNEYLVINCNTNLRFSLCVHVCVSTLVPLKLIIEQYIFLSEYLQCGHCYYMCL